MKNGSISPENSLEYIPSTNETGKHGCSREKKKRLIIGLIVFSLIILVIGLFYLGFSVKVETCTTQQCVHVSSLIRKHMDLRADPCDDFYRVACGNFMQSSNNPNTQSQGYYRQTSVEDITQEDILLQIRDLLQSPIRSEDSKAFNVAKKFYRACLNETAIAGKGLKQIKQIFHYIGGWPTLEGDNWKEAEFDWMETLHKLRNLGLNFNVFFRVSVDRDPEVSASSPKYILGIHEIPYTPLELNSEVKSMLFEYMVELSVRFGANRALAQTDAREVLRLIQDLSKIYKESQLKNETGNDYERLALSELQYKYPDIQWHYHINGLLKPVEHFNYDDEVIIMHPRYIQYMETFLGVTSRRSLANLIVWHTLQNLIDYMPEEFIERKNDLIERMNGGMMNFRLERWKYCVQETKTRLSPVLSAAYIQNYFPEDTRYKVLTMIRVIKKQFEENVMQLEWMDYETKDLIVKKLHATGEKLASYGDLLSLFEQNKLYGQVLVNQTEFLQAVMDINLVSLQQKQSKLRDYYEEDYFSDINFVAGLQIKYSAESGILIFPVGVFTGIYYQNDRPEYMNYGILGSIIAHEVSHIFMRSQHGDSPRGELRTWWSANSLANYGGKLRCFSNQHTTSAVAELNGKQLSPSEEALAELTGIKIAYEAYNTWIHQNAAQTYLPGLKYSPKQLFWISNAIGHCFKKLLDNRFHDNVQANSKQGKINAPLRNLKEFSLDFGCKLGSRMNPDNKCEFW